MRITIDTREQTPWSFPLDCVEETTLSKLDEGDYALSGDNGFAIERKSLDDFVQTVSIGWDRFKRELNRMSEKGFPIKVIVVEGDFCSFCFSPNGEPPTHSHPRISPQFLVKRIAQLTYDYRCAVLFAGNAPLATGLAVQIFRRREKDLEND